MRLHISALLSLACAACRPAAAPATPAQATPCPTLPPPPATFTIESKVLGETRRINVYTPPAYLEQPDARFPVLYMPDGGMEEDFPHVTDAVKAGTSWQILRPMIVIGIENTERRRDLSGPTEVEADRKIAPRVGGSAAFRAFIRKELMPEIRIRYRTTDDAAIVGESLAGFFVVETLLLEPDLFDTYIAFSPSLQWNNQSLVRRAGDLLKVHPDLRATLYLTTANEEDIVAATELLAKTLESSAPPGLQWTYYPRPDEFHDTIYRASAPRAFRLLFAAPTAAK